MVALSSLGDCVRGGLVGGQVDGNWWHISPCRGGGVLWHLQGQRWTRAWSHGPDEPFIQRRIAGLNRPPGLNLYLFFGIGLPVQVSSGTVPL